MPTWGEIIKEIEQHGKKHPGASPFDAVRRKYLAALAAKTGRNTILYATRWTQGGVSDQSVVSIVNEDVHAFMEVVHGLDSQKGLDLILHSPGGSPEAAEAIIQYLRSKFTSIRVVVPQAAMSAATMLSCGANEIVMGKHSSLGPIDPQMIMPMPNGVVQMAPAQAIIDQFEKAVEDCKDAKKLGAWIPILPQYGPALLMQCQNALKLAEELASEWLRNWMFANSPDGAKKASDVAKALADHTQFKSHGRPIHRDAAEKLGLKILPLEADQTVQDLVLSVHHATMHVFSIGPVVAKIVENHMGRAFVKSQQMIAMGAVQKSPPQQLFQVQQIVGS